MQGNGPASPSFLAGGGEMGELIRSMDWSQTPLGPPETWPQSLRTTLNLSLASNFPICFIWGPERVQIYNDGYWPICGTKHPRSMGQDYRECWFSAWPVIGPGFEQCVERGETSFFTDTGMFLDRNGYLEETFFTFSFSPIRDDGGRVAGVFHPVTETTHLVLAERRLQVLRELAGRTADARSIDEALAITAEELRKHRLDLPFVLLYRLASEPEVAVLVGAAGLQPGAPGAPEQIDLSQVGGGWPIAEVADSGQMVSVDDLEALFGRLSGGPYPEPPQRALLFPIIAAGANRPTAVLVAGVSSRRALDEPYLRFFEMLAAGVTTAVSKASAYEEEKRHAEVLAELDRAKTAFFSNVSHEFRTPLTLMLGPLEDLLNDPSSLPESAAREQLEVVHRNGLRLLKLVNTLLDFSRIEAGRAQPNFTPVDLASFTMNLAAAFRSTIEAAGLRLVVDCPSGGAQVQVDPEMWEKIVLNLLSNAFKFTLEGEIAVQLRWEAEQVILTVRDSGTGIPREELPRIFERFHRVKGAVGRSYEGSGIGLSLVQELVRIHGGAIHAVSEPGVGSVFTVELPLGIRRMSPERAHRASVDATPQQAQGFVSEVARWLTEEHSARAHVPLPRASQAAAESGAAAANGSGRPRVMIADDNADMRDYLVSLLEARYEVVALPDGAAALTAALENPPGLILSDVMMPNLEGFGLLSAIRNDPRTQTTPFILLSARAGAEARVDGLEAGADDYLVKPFSAAELLARVETNLRLAQLRQEIERAAGREEALREANRRKDEFLAMLSHELRNPLSPILTSAAVLQRDGLESALVKRQCVIIHRQTALLRRLLDDLLDTARITRGKISLQFERLDLVEAACQAVEACRPAAVARDQELTLEAKEPPIWVDADPVRIDQILCNLIHNSVKFTSRNGRIQVSLAREGNAAQIRVRDNGEGIAADLAPNIFDLFTQGEQEIARSQGGLGIGLTMVRTLTELHGGTVEAHSRGVGHGSEFTIMLPLAPEPQDEPGRNASEEPI